MAKKHETKPVGPAPDEPPAPPADPLAGKSADEKRAALEAAKAADEAAKPKVPAKAGDEAVKAEALALMSKIAAADLRVREARLACATAEDGNAATEAVVGARAKRAALKAQLSALYLAAPDSVQAAETELAAAK